MACVTVINDSTEFLTLMRDLLTEIGHEMVGFEAVEASIGQVVASEPDLLIVDLRLENTPQEVSGWELIVLARAHRDLRDVPIILCTGDLVELKQRRADLRRIANVHLITKPFDFDEMSSLIAQALATGA